MITCWLLELDLAGRVLRWSVDPLEIDGVTYRGGLEDLTVAEGATSLAVRLVDRSVRWSDLAPLTVGARLTLRRWVEGTALELAAVVLSGAVDGVDWDTDDQAVALSATIDDPLVRGAQVPGPLARCGSLTWPEAGATLGDEGVAYPILLGYPGYEGSDPPYAAMPVALAQWSSTRSSTLAVVCEDPDAPVTACNARNESTLAEAVQTVARAVDLLGRAVRCVHWGVSATGYPSSATAARELWVGFSPRDGGGAARSAYEVIVYVLRRWGADTYEPDRLADLEPVLGAYQVDTWIDQPVADAWTWLERALLPDLPVAVRVGSTGRRYLVPLVYAPRATEVVAELELGRDVAAASRLTLERPGPFNEFSAEFRSDRSGAYRARVIVTGREAPREVDDVLPLTVAPSSTASQSVIVVRSGRCAASRALYGHRGSSVQVIDWTWDEGTVLRVLEDRVEREALPAIRTSYRVSSRLRLRWREGDVVTITDPDRRLEARLATVAAPPVVGSTSTTITVRIPR